MMKKNYVLYHIYMNELCWSNGHIYNDFKDIYNNVVKYLSFGLKNEDFNYFLLKLNKEQNNNRRRSLLFKRLLYE